MRKYRLYLLLALLLCFGTGARADNIVMVSSGEGVPGDEVTISIGLQNTDAVAMLQVSIPLDENLTLVENSGQVGSRCNSHSLTVGIKDGVLNVFVYSMMMSTISGNSGEVASFRLRLGNQPQSFSLTPSKLVLTNSSGDAIEGSCETGSVITRCAKAQYSTMEVDYGEVPIRSSYERTVTVTNVGNADLTITALTFSDVNVFSSTTTLPVNISAGQSKQLNITYAPEKRGTISKTLKVECNSVSKLNTITLKAQPFAVNELHIQPASGISDEEVTVSMTMNNMDAISGYQVEFTLPEQFEYVENSFALSSRKQDHVGMATLKGNILRIIVYSPTDKALTGDDGEIGSFKIKLTGRYGTTLTPNKTVLSATFNNKVENVVSAVYGGQISIQSPQIFCNNTLDMGAVSVTENCEKTLTVINYGNAPLTISRVTFDNENMSVKEELPLVVSSWVNKTLTVVYNNVDQTAFEGTMNIYSNDPEQRMKTVTVSGSRFAPNYMAVSTSDITTRDKLAIDISLDNYAAITGMQFDVEYPDQYYTPFANNYTLESRANGMTVTMNSIDENTLRVFCYFLSGGSISAGSGKVMTLQLEPLSSETPESKYTVRIKNITMGTQELTDKYAGGNLQSSFNVTYVELGDANGDGNVNVTDIVEAVNYILNKPSTMFIFTAADVNQDDIVNVTDIVNMVSIIMSPAHIPAHAAKNAQSANRANDAQVDKLKVDDVALTAGEEKLIAIELVNSERLYSAFQFDLVLPEGVSIATNSKGKLVASLDAERMDDHSLSVEKIGDNTYRFVAFSLTNAEFYGNSGALVNLTIKAADSLTKNAKTAQIVAQAFTTKNAVQYNLGDITFTIKAPVAPITITAKSYTREYGDQNPVFEYTSEGAELNGTPTISCTATLTSPVGTYPIVIGKGSVTNDNDMYVNGTLTITKAPLTITAQNATREEGQENPGFVLLYSGWKNNETESVLTVKPMVVTTATIESPAGEYSITVSGAESQNYSITYVDGVLTVTSTSTAINELLASGCPFDIYTTTGILVRRQSLTLMGLPAGLYVINGSKVVVK